MCAVCLRCGASVLDTGEAKVLVPFAAAADVDVAERLFLALGLIDADREQLARAERAL